VLAGWKSSNAGMLSRITAIDPISLYS